MGEYLERCSIPLNECNSSLLMQKTEVKASLFLTFSGLGIGNVSVVVLAQAAHEGAVKLSVIVTII